MVDAADKVAFEAADRFALGLGALLGEVDGGLWIVADADDGEHVAGAVEPTVGTWIRPSITLGQKRRERKAEHAALIFPVDSAAAKGLLNVGGGEMRNHALRWVASGLLVSALVAVIAGGQAPVSLARPVARAAQAPNPVILQISFSNLRGVLLLQYDSPTSPGPRGNQMSAQSGSMAAASFGLNALIVQSAGSGPLSAVGYTSLIPPGDGQPITGHASFPAGTNVTVQVQGSPSVSIKNGAFSIPTAGALGAPRVMPLVVRCRGTRRLCRASLSLAGGANHKPVIVKLPAHNLALRSVQASRRSLRGAYALSNRRFREKGSEYAFNLDAVGSIKRGSLTLTFAIATPHHGLG